MSRFASEDINKISPYVPGEQPRDKKYIKLNTNENPFEVSERAVESVSRDFLANLRRYSDPTCKALHEAVADFYGVDSANVLTTNGSDEALAFAFYAYCRKGVCYADVTYGFYDVIANLFGCPQEHIPLQSDFTINAADYYNKEKTVVIANPNAQTGIALGLDKIEAIIKNNPENIVIIDQAYADFSNCNAVPLIKRYKNLVIVNTFSKSRSLAGARVGFVIADEALIEDLKKVKNSFHPYNVNSVSAALAAAAVSDKQYFDFTVGKVIEGREKLTEGLIGLGYEVLPSSANFVLAKSPEIDGCELYKMLKERGVLVRHLSDERIKSFVRITVGTDEEMDELLKILTEIENEKG